MESKPKEVPLIRQLDDYTLELTTYLRSPMGKRGMLQKIMSSQSIEEAEDYYDKFLNAPAAPLRQFWSIEPIEKMKRIRQLQNVLNYFGIKYPLPSDEIQRSLSENAEMLQQAP